MTIVDTDIFHDPDDAIMLITAARTVESLIVVTADEVPAPDSGDGLRARAARLLLDGLGRHDVPVITGASLGGHRISLDHALLAELPRAPRFDLDDLRDRLRARIEQTTQPVRWLGCGPMTNLAELLLAAPDLAEQIELVQMGGWLDPARYRHPDRASHNLHADPTSAGTVLRMLPNVRLVLSEHTAAEQIRVGPQWPLYQRLTGPNAPAWAQLPGANFAIWCLTRSGSWMHDPLTLSAALDLGFVRFRPERIRIACDARLSRDPAGRAVQVSDSVDYDSFLAWLETATATTPATAGTGGRR
ncbi:nucleoside hydrolase [Nocardia sp. NPDC050435]|uniref:nucleoside hydrolase n=1 Tax=Nocardia sp. NPDC050435 TaxID=3155040 RepID=UPI0034041C4F